MSAPNIVFVLTDDHAAHAISAYGSRINSTPHIDRIAREGSILNAMYCTNSICSPSRASILTGTYSHVNGVPGIFTEIDYRVPTFVDVLHDAGYATALFGKWHLGESKAAQPRGFDAWRVFPGQGEYIDPVMIDEHGSTVVPGYATDIVTDMSIQWLSNDRAADRPFALFVHHKAPHRPWIPDDRHRDMYPVGSIPEPATFYDSNTTRGTWTQRLTMSIADDLTEVDIKEPTPDSLLGAENSVARAKWKYQRYMRDYLQCVQSIDDNVGRLLDWLDQAGQSDNTIVVYCSDQGFFLGDHGWFDKRLMFEQSLQMPVVIRWPKHITPGTAVEEIVTNVDFAATLLECCGLDPVDALPSSQGRSFAPLLRGEEVADWPDAMYYRYWENDEPNHHAPAHYGIATKEYKLICYYGDGLGLPGTSARTFPMEWELYDLRVDPQEIYNVINDVNYERIIKELREELAALQEKYGDTPYTGPDTKHPDWGEGFQQFS